MAFKMIDSLQTRDAIREALDEKLAAVISEMQDSPDQLQYGLTRDQVMKMHQSYEIHQMSDNTYIDDNYSRDIEGSLRAVKHQPEAESDFLPDEFPDNADQIRPAGLQAYDLEFSYPEEDDEEDFEDDTRGIVRMEEDVASADQGEFLEQVIKHALSVGHDIELILADGTCICLDTHTLNAIRNAKALDELQKHLGDVEEFATFLKQIYGPASGNIHHEVEGGEEE